jgi:hypothetical protein
MSISLFYDQNHGKGDQFLYHKVDGRAIDERIYDFNFRQTQLAWDPIREIDLASGKAG